MVLTRSERRKLLTERFDINRSANMNSETTTATRLYTTGSIPVTTMSYIPAPVALVTATTTAPSIAPSVQEFLTLAQDRSVRPNDSHVSNNSITSPEYSSITARNLQQAYRQNSGNESGQPVGHNSNITKVEEIINIVRGEFRKPMEDIQQMIQSIRQSLNGSGGSQENRHDNGLGSQPRPPPPSAASQAWRDPNLQYNNQHANILAINEIHPSQQPYAAASQNQQLNDRVGTNYQQTQYFTQPQQPYQVYNQQPPIMTMPRQPPQNQGDMPSAARQYEPPIQQYEPPIQQYEPPIQRYEPPIQQPPLRQPQERYIRVPNANYPYDTQQKVDVSKWGIKFDGTTKTMSAEDFIFRVDVLRQDYNCTFNDIRRSFHHLLEGQALDWYWNERKLAQISTWEELQASFLQQYRRYENEFQIQKKIMDRRQLPQESFEDFYTTIIKLRNQQRTPYSEKDLVEIMKGNLKPSLAHLLFPVRMEGLSHFCQEVKRAENLLAGQRQQYQQRPYVQQRVHEIAYGEEDVPIAELEVDAIATSSKYTCWNCRLVGHSFVDCPSPTRRIFCYKCGRDNVVTPKCPKCQGNQARNATRTGETRSTQT